jgi:CHAT domain-containing protein
MHSIIHFAGHAVFNTEQPELSYLALTPDGPGGSGILRAWEIGGLRLSNVDVVVLSACSSLSPRASRTGAISGLAYSFLRAGAPATVSTLWDVEDGSTTELLTSFHRHLAAGKLAIEALRLAQTEALASAVPGRRAPRAWAAFIYTGP